MSRTASGPPIERASANDLVTLASDRGPAPMNIGAVLVLEGAADLPFAAVLSALEDRLSRVPRLRQRLLATPFGCGRPVWVDHPDFDLSQHLSMADLTTAPVPEEDSATTPDERVLRVAAELVCARLPRDRPLWAARWVGGLSGDRAALVLVMHHVMTDGVGGLAVLAALGDAALGDDSPQPVRRSFPLPAPSRWSLASAAWRDRLVGVRQVPHRLRPFGQGLRELGVRGGPPAWAARTSLNRPTGPRRRLSTVDVALADVLAVAHARDCTLNDVVLTGVVGAMAAVLGHRGETPGELIVSVPISARHEASVAELGNQTGVRPLAVPTMPDPDARLRTVAAISRAHRGTRGPRGASAGPMSIAFRGMSAVGLFQVFIDHQRFVHTFVTNVRGPATSMRLGGHLISNVVPVAVTPGNVGVCFDVLSYAGRLVITVVADPDIVPDQALLTVLLKDQLALLLQ